ncbi:MAG: lysophospholipid acyltransferase family protein [Candidatus Firestonebacteria bacterium]|nr:lysophospholipid acyltransferase family protein [Candidatus Firestonebacteria bacterium]
MSLLHYLEYGFIKYISNYVERNTLEKSYKFAKKLGNLSYNIDKKHCNIARDNLIKSFGNEKSPEEIEKIISQNFINIAYIGVEFLYLPKFDKSFLEKNVIVEGIHHFENALKEGKGVINITGHLGNWELLGALYTLYGFDLSVIARRQSNSLVNTFVLAQRTNKNINIIPHKEANRKSLKALKNNHILGVIADQDAGANGIFVNFFGRPASTARGPAVLYRKTESPVIMSFLLRDEPGKFRLIVEKPLKFIKTENKDNDVLFNTLLWSNILEMYIRRYPEQWFWVHRRWKTKKTREK